jgi:hypothetical protein
MVEGGRNLEKEIMESFFEEVDRDDTINETTLEELKQLEEQNELTNSEAVIRIAQEEVKHASQGNRD